MLTATHNFAIGLFSTNFVHAVFWFSKYFGTNASTEKALLDLVNVVFHFVYQSLDWIILEKLGVCQFFLTIWDKYLGKIYVNAKHTAKFAPPTAGCPSFHLPITHFQEKELTQQNLPERSVC